MPNHTIIHQTYLSDETLKQTGVTHTEYRSYLESGNYIIKMTSRGVYYGTFKSNIRYELTLIKFHDASSGVP